MAAAGLMKKDLKTIKLVIKQALGVPESDPDEDITSNDISRT